MNCFEPFWVFFSLFWTFYGTSTYLIRRYKSTSGYKIRQCKKFVENELHPYLQPQIEELSESGATVTYFDVLPFTGFRTDTYISCEKKGIELWKSPKYEFEKIVISLLLLGGFVYLTFKKTSKK